MSRTLIVLWAYFMSWICSAFLHLVDPDVEGFQGLLVPSVLLSISVLALLVMVPAILCRAAYFRRSWKGFFGVVAVFAIVFGFVVVAVGFGGYSAQSRLLSFAGMSALFGLVFISATVPTIWIEGAWRTRARART